MRPDGTPVTLRECSPPSRHTRALLLAALLLPFGLDAAVVRGPGAAWTQALSALSPAQVQTLSRQLRVDLARPDLRAALIEVMSGAEQAPAASAELAPQLGAELQRRAAGIAGDIRALRLEGWSPERSAELNALFALKDALPEGARRELESGFREFHGERVQSLIAGAASWNAAAAEPAARGRLSAWLPRLKRHEPAAARPAKPAPAVERVAVPGAPELGELVGLLRAIDALPPERASGARAEYASWFASPEALEAGLARLRARETPARARLDAVIFNQAGSVDDALGELVLNGVDTMLEKAGLGARVGRFGVGAFQVLQELENPGDRIVIETASALGRVLRVELSIAEKAEPARIGEQLRARLSVSNDAAFGTGTRIRVLKAGGLSAERRTRLEGTLRAKLAGSDRARVTVNGRELNPLTGWRELGAPAAPAHAIPGEVAVLIGSMGYEVRDRGLGMDERALLERFLIPRRSSKAASVSAPDEAAARAQTRLLYRGDPNGKAGELSRMRVTLGVSGVAVESFEVQGLQLPEEVYLELPPGSWLPESRNKVEVNALVWLGLKALTERALKAPVEQGLGLLNALAAIAGYLENPRAHPESASAGESFARWMSERLDRVPGVRRLERFDGESGRRAYALALEDRERVYLEYGSGLLFDEGVYERLKDRPALLNFLLNFQIGYGPPRAEKGRFRAASAPRTAGAGPSDDAFESALDAAPWSASLMPEARRRVLRHLRGLRGGSVPAELRRLGEIASFADGRLGVRDWTSSLLGEPLETVRRGRGAERTRVHALGERVAYVIENGEESSIIVDGETVWKGRGAVGPVARFGEDGWSASVTRFLEGGRRELSVIVDGETAWSGDAERVEGEIVRLPSGKPAFWTRSSKVWRLHAGRDAIASLPEGDYLAATRHVAAGARSALRVETAGRRNEFFLDGARVWAGPWEQNRAPLLEHRGRIYFAAVAQGGWRLHENGRPMEQVYAWMSEPAMLDGQPAFLAQEVPDGPVHLIVGGRKTWTSTGRLHMAQGAEGFWTSDGHWGFGALRPDGRALAFYDGNGQVLDDALLERIHWVGDQPAFVLRPTLGNRRWAADGYVILYRGEEIWTSGPDSPPERVLTAGGRIAILGRGPDYKFLTVDGLELASSPGLIDAAAAGSRLYLLGSDGSVSRVALGATRAGSSEGLTRRETEAFADAHAYDLRASEKPWGRRLLRGLLAPVPGESVESALPLLPFLEGAARRGLGRQAAAGFAALVEKEPWDKVEQIAAFMRELRGVAADDGEYTRFAERWLTLVDADWNRAKEFAEQMAKRHGSARPDGRVRDAGLVNLKVTAPPGVGARAMMEAIADRGEQVRTLDEPGSPRIFLAKVQRSLAGHEIFTLSRFISAGLELEIDGEDAGRFFTRHFGAPNAIGDAKRIAEALRRDLGAAAASVAAKRARVHVLLPAGSRAASSLLAAIREHDEAVKIVSRRGTGEEIFELVVEGPSTGLALRGLRRLEKAKGLKMSVNDEPSDSFFGRIKGNTLPPPSEIMEALFGGGPAAAEGALTGLDFLRRERDPKDAPGRLRGYIHFMRAARAELLKPREPEAPSRARVLGALRELPLALLTLARRQRPAALARERLTLEEYARALQGLEGYSTEGMEAEIDSAIRGQDQSELLWVRELIQNARDALRRAWREKTLPERTGEVAVDSFRRGDDWVVRVEDPVGMSLRTLANFFFPLDESDKRAGADAGRFGQGLYTLFGDFDEARVRTGTGDGVVHEIVVRRRGGRLTVTEFRALEERWRGTRIERVKRVDRDQRVPVELEAAFVTQAVFDYTGTVQDVVIRYQGERAGEPATELAALELAPWGRLRLLETPSRVPRITQDDLSVSDPGLQAELLALLPDWMRALWRERGWTLDLPGGLPPARSRAGLARKELALPRLQAALLAASARTAARLYFTEGLPIPALPPDFYYAQGLTMDALTARDAVSLNAGRWSEIDWKRYADDGLALGRLIALIEVELNGARTSAWKVRQDVLAQRAVKLQGISAELSGTLSRSQDKIARRAKTDALPSKVFTEAELRASPALSRFRDLNLVLLRLLGEPPQGWTIRFYEKDEDASAHFRNKTISWNLFHNRRLTERWLALTQAGAEPDDKFFSDFLEIFVHEYTHYSDQNWTHEADEALVNGFAWRMRRNIEKLIRAGLDLDELRLAFQKQSVSSSPRSR